MSTCERRSREFREVPWGGVELGKILRTDVQTVRDSLRHSLPGGAQTFTVTSPLQDKSVGLLLKEVRKDENLAFQP